MSSAVNEFYTDGTVSRSAFYRCTARNILTKIFLGSLRLWGTHSRRADSEGDKRQASANPKLRQTFANVVCKRCKRRKRLSRRLQTKRSFGNTMLGVTHVTHVTRVTHDSILHYETNDHQNTYKFTYNVSHTNLHTKSPCFWRSFASTKRRCKRL